MDSYVLGILWSLGVYREEEGKYFELRYKSPYHLDIVAKYYSITDGVKPGQNSRGGDQYSLILPRFEIASLLDMGWAEWRSKERSYPIGDIDHASFLRAYFEIHAVMDYQRRRQRNSTITTSVRLRVYGNHGFIEQVNDVLYSQLNIPRHRVQTSVNGTAYLILTDLSQIETIIDYIDGQPKDAEWWDRVEKHLSTPRPTYIPK